MQTILDAKWWYGRIVLHLSCLHTTELNADSSAKYGSFPYHPQDLVGRRWRCHKCERKNRATKVAKKAILGDYEEGQK